MPEFDTDDVTVRVMRESDLEDIISIDERVTGQRRESYYRRKMAGFLSRESSISVSMVAEHEGRVVGFIMGNLYTGEFGIPETVSFLDTIGVDPEFTKSGVGSMLMDEFRTNLRALGVKRIRTLVNWGELGLVRFFQKTGFTPSPTLNLEFRL